jgi:hypothetical protein
VVGCNVQGSTLKKKSTEDEFGRTLLIISDTIGRKAKCGCLTTGENENEIVKFLFWLKRHVRKEPLYSTIDFRSKLDDAIKEEEHYIN